MQKLQEKQHQLLPLIFQMTFCFNLPNALASVSTTSWGGEDIIEPKETKTTPASPELDTKRSNFSGNDAAGLGNIGPTITTPDGDVKNYC